MTGKSNLSATERQCKNESIYVHNKSGKQRRMDLTDWEENKGIIDQI